MPSFSLIWPLIWVTVSFPILLLVQRWIHRHLRGFALLLTGREGWSIAIYALILLPGVFIHELSHWLTASLLGVRTGKFSIMPRQQKDGSLQMGYVEYYRTKDLGPIRESLIGAAPLIFGITAILLINHFVFRIPTLGRTGNAPNWSGVGNLLSQVVQAKDFLLWLYLLFAISNAMMPSESDRRAWPGVLIVSIFLGVGVVLLSLTPFLLNGILPPLSTFCSYLAFAFTLTIVIDLLFMIVIAFGEWSIGRLRNQRINYH